MGIRNSRRYRGGGRGGGERGEKKAPTRLPRTGPRSRPEGASRGRAREGCGAREPTRQRPGTPMPGHPDRSGSALASQEGPLQEGVVFYSKELTN